MTAVGSDARYSLDGPAGGPGRATGPGLRFRRLGVAGIAAAAALAWLPFVGKQLSPDEGGFLLVASQWSPGTSLYGDYWVDRPPLLIALFGLVDRLGGSVALRPIGIGFVVVSVVVAGALGALASRPTAAWGALVPAAVAAIFLSTPLFGTTEVDGELLAVPFVLGGVAALLRSCLADSRRSVFAWAMAAGALAAGAALIKQNVVDVFVFAAVVTVQLARSRPGRSAAGRLVAFGTGALVATAVAVAAATARGTRPGALWDAVIMFRFDAAAVIRASANDATAARFHSLLLAFLFSGAPLVVAACAVRLRATVASVDPPARPVPDLRWPAAAVAAWEVAAVAMGGSYWLHYLIGVVPGLVLLVVAAGQRPRSRSSAGLLGATVYAAIAAVAVVGWAAIHPPDNDADAQVVAYLRAHAAAGDSVVVGFGHPNIVADAGLTSPYSELWSLPVRVRDNQLAELTGVLEGPARPTWVVVSGDTLATWGVQPDTAQAQLEQRYRQVAALGGYLIYHAQP
ncbi:MAG: hypothetical protein JWO11_2528 [Nocardioides sp.]|nr:hypothetical protein [Nocardioides sp.]